mgnify:CR=1 FL=1
MSWLVDFFFGKSTETLEAMKADRERRIAELQNEVAEINRLIAERGN